jgi:hypothetical protein
MFTFSDSRQGPPFYVFAIHTFYTSIWKCSKLNHPRLCHVTIYNYLFRCATIWKGTNCGYYTPLFVQKKAWTDETSFFLWPTKFKLEVICFPLCGTSCVKYTIILRTICASVGCQKFPTKEKVHEKVVQTVLITTDKKYNFNLGLITNTRKRQLDPKSLRKSSLSQRTLSRFHVAVGQSLACLFIS